MDKFEVFQAKEKFIEDNSIVYPGLADLALKPVLTEKINQVANDFKELANKSNTIDKDYLEQIKKGLKYFNDIDLDTEEKERICHYFEELMDIVGLESSNGLLNNFLYGFDPNEKL